MRVMKTRVLGNSDMALSAIGLGAWAIGGGGWAFGWGPQDDAASVAAIHEALDLGVNWIDTAAVYGLGHSETIVARALAAHPGPRPYVFTKCGLRWDTQGRIRRDLSPASIREECEASLRRLRMEVIDLYQIHWPSDGAGEIEAAWGALADLQQAGKVRWIGVSNFDAGQMRRALAIAPVTSLQPPYSMIRRDIEAEVLPLCQRQGIGVIAYSPMASGLLTGTMTRERLAGLPADDWRRGEPMFQEPALSRHLAVVERLRPIAARHGCSPGEVAVAWVLRHPAVTAAIVGVRSAEQVRGVAGAATLELEPTDLAEIEAALGVAGTSG